MKKHPLFSVLLWLGAGIAGVAMASAIHLGPDDIEFEADQTAELAALQTAAPGSPAQLKAARALCRQERGPMAQALWLPDGSLVCRDMKGGVL